MNENERKNIIILGDTIQGEINRMCVTDSLTELDTMYAHARRNLDKLLTMIYEKRFDNLSSYKSEKESEK